jgi:hypothetical protein
MNDNRKIVIKPSRPSHGIWQYNADGTVTHHRKPTKKLKEAFRSLGIEFDE